ncbi:hypothetical protein DSO57_1010722 [Entomophthora muscae]|uniref:Uncharacterized protein n=1 Tax=Entomophthora muscae TaxID=34485 RepID=A0ACC2U487_9FUNG|nr:hypothetical protein DSO57_1010722 [Entomophthora muscae]
MSGYPSDFIYDANMKLEDYPDFMYVPIQEPEMSFPAEQAVAQGFMDYDTTFHSGALDFAPENYGYGYPMYYAGSDGNLPAMTPSVDMAPYRANSVPQFRKKGAPPKQSSRQSESLPSVHITSTGKRCTNCRCEETPSWRRCQNGVNLLCNACGLYEKLHCRPRPIFIDKDGYIKVVRDRRPRSSDPSS